MPNTNTPRQEAAPPRLGRRPSTSREQLERVALALFARAGFDATSVEDIAAAAGIGRRTFFRYYSAKADLVWGDFDDELTRLRTWFAEVDGGVPMMEAVRQAVLAFNRLHPDNVAQHRLRMSLILRVPTLLADSTLRFVQWRGVVAGFAASRLGVPADDVLPVVVGYSTLGATMAAYEVWLRNDGADLETLLSQALGELAVGFEHRGRP